MAAGGVRAARGDRPCDLPRGADPRPKIDDEVLVARARAPSRPTSARWAPSGPRRSGASGCSRPGSPRIGARADQRPDRARPRRQQRRGGGAFDHGRARRRRVRARGRTAVEAAGAGGSTDGAARHAVCRAGEMDHHRAVLAKAPGAVSAEQVRSLIETIEEWVAAASASPWRPWWRRRSRRRYRRDEDGGRRDRSGRRRGLGGLRRGRGRRGGRGGSSRRPPAAPALRGRRR